MNAEGGGGGGREKRKSLLFCFLTLFLFHRCEKGKDEVGRTEEMLIGVFLLSPCSPPPSPSLPLPPPLPLPLRRSPETNQFPLSSFRPFPSVRRRRAAKSGKKHQICSFSSSSCFCCCSSCVSSSSGHCLLSVLCFKVLKSERRKREAFFLIGCLWPAEKFT